MAFGYYFITKYPKTIKNIKKYILVEIYDEIILIDSDTVHKCRIRCMDPELNPQEYESGDFKHIPNTLNLDVRYIYAHVGTKEENEFKVTSGINRDICITAYNMMKDIYDFGTCDINCCEFYVNSTDIIF